MTKPQSLLTLDSFRGDGHEKGVCKLGRILRKFSPENQATLNEALAGPEVEFPSGRIEDALGEIGVSVGTDTIIKHRRGTCACKKP